MFFFYKFKEDLEKLSQPSNVCNQFLIFFFLLLLYDTKNYILKYLGG